MLAQSVNHVTLDRAPRPTKSEGDSANAKQTERSLKGKGDGDFRGMVRSLRVGADREQSLR